ncbi:hypothetical protein Prudu_322S000200, partial [Prunus dulcis]
MLKTWFLTGPDPLEFEPDPVRVRHLADGKNIRAVTKNLQRSQSFYKTKVLHQRKGAEDGKRPGGGFLCTSTAWGRKTLKRDSRDCSPPDPHYPLYTSSSTKELVGQLSSMLTKLKSPLTGSPSSLDLLKVPP